MVKQKRKSRKKWLRLRLKWKRFSQASLPGAGENDVQVTRTMKMIPGTQTSQVVQDIPDIQASRDLQATQGIQGIQNIQCVREDQTIQNAEGIRGVQTTQSVRGVLRIQPVQGIHPDRVTQDAQVNQEIWSTPGHHIKILQNCQLKSSQLLHLHHLLGESSRKKVPPQHNSSFWKVSVTFSSMTNVQCLFAEYHTDTAHSLRDKTSFSWMSLAWWYSKKQHTNLEHVVNGGWHACNWQNYVRQCQQTTKKELRQKIQNIHSFKRLNSLLHLLSWSVIVSWCTDQQTRTSAGTTEVSANLHRHQISVFCLIDVNFLSVSLALTSTTSSSHGLPNANCCPGKAAQCSETELQTTSLGARRRSTRRVFWNTSLWLNWFCSVCPFGRGAGFIIVLNSPGDLVSQRPNFRKMKCWRRSEFASVKNKHSLDQTVVAENSLCCTKVLVRMCETKFESTRFSSIWPKPGWARWQTPNLQTWTVGGWDGAGGWVRGEGGVEFGWEGGWGVKLGGKL